MLAGHDHGYGYERLPKGSVPFFITGAGGAPLGRLGPNTDPDSEVTYVDGFGALIVDACEDRLSFEFHSVTDDLVDTFALGEPDCGRPLVMPGAVGGIEGDNGSVEAALPVRLDQPATTPVTVDWTTLGIAAAGVAEEGVDFVAASGVVTFLPGETEPTVPVEILGDTEDEPPLYLGEWALVSFSNPSPNADLDLSFYGLGIVIIADDD